MTFLCCWRRTRARSVRVLAAGSSPGGQHGQPQASPMPLTVKGAGSSPDRQHGQAQASPMPLTANGAGSSPDKQRSQPQASPVPMTVNRAGSSPDSRQCDQSQESPVPVAATNVEGGRYTLAELNHATDSFSPDRQLGFGGFGKVYKGVLSDGTKVAVKRRDATSSQGVKEFRAEIEVCLGLRHPNLVCLLGYCDEGDEMMLVYEYMEQGTLASHLYGSGSRLTWEQRLKILIEAATGLHYLHTLKGIIHRDMKSANILLDENLVGKIADFGLVRIGPELGRTHVTTEVRGTPGFLDAEYHRTKHLTYESDVYAFGVVVLVAICARKAFDYLLPTEETTLATWGLKKIKRGRLQEIVDESIRHTIRPECLEDIGKIVKKCLAESHRDRPSMEEVISELQTIQKLQYVLSNSMPADMSSPASSRPCSPPCPLSDLDSDSSDSPIINIRFVGPAKV